MSKDVRQLRDEAGTASASGRHKRALECYTELEQLEPRDAQWPKRAAEAYRKLNKTRAAIDAFDRAADRYAQNGFMVQAIAVCKLILQIDPNHVATQQRLAAMNAAQSAGPTRIGGLADGNAALHENPAVQAVRNRAIPSGVMPAVSRSKAEAAAPPARVKSLPIVMAPGAALESVLLGNVVAGAHQRRKDDGSASGIVVIPLEDGDEFEPDYLAIEDVPVDASDLDEPLEIETEEPDEVEELELADIEEVPIAEPRRVSVSARRALAATPLFASMDPAALEALIEYMALVSLEAGDVLFREGDPGDSLFIVVDGEVAVMAEGPPRVEMSRLSAGAFFGEVSLMTDGPRSATVSALSSAELLRIDRATLAHVLGEHPDVLRVVLRFVRDRLVDRWVRTSPLFRPFEDGERRALAAKFRFLEIEPGAVLIAASTRADGLYIILAGAVDVKRAGVITATLGPGDLIGETSLLHGQPFKSDVVAREKCLALCLPAGQFREMIMTHPHVLEYIGEQADAHRQLKIL